MSAPSATPAPRRPRFRRLKKISLSLALLLAGMVLGSGIRSSLRPKAPGFPATDQPGKTAARAGVDAVPGNDPVKATAAAARFTSMAERQAAWRQKILAAAETDLTKALRMYQEMPSPVPRRTAAGTMDPMADLLSELFSRHGPDALKAALAAGVDVPRCFEGLTRAKGVTEAGPYLKAYLEGTGDAATPVAAEDLGRIMRFLGRADLTDSAAAWKLLAPHVRTASLDGEAIKALAGMARTWDARGINAALTEEVLASLDRPWDASRLRQELLGRLADLRGKSPELESVITAALGAEPGASQARAHAATTAARMAFSGNPVDALSWAAGQTDAAARQAAFDGALGYLGGVSRFRPLKVVLSDPGLRQDGPLVERVVRMAVGDASVPGSRDTADVQALREAAAADQEISNVLRHPDLAPLFR